MSIRRILGQVLPDVRTAAAHDGDGWHVTCGSCQSTVVADSEPDANREVAEHVVGHLAVWAKLAGASLLAAGGCGLIVGLAAGAMGGLVVGALMVPISAVILRLSSRPVTDARRRRNLREIGEAIGGLGGVLLGAAITIAALAFLAYADAEADRGPLHLTWDCLARWACGLIAAIVLGELAAWAARRAAAKPINPNGQRKQP